MDSAVDSMNVEDIQLSVFKAIRTFLIKELDVDSEGNIKRSIKNLKTVQKVKLLRNLIITDKYKDKVIAFINTFDEVRDLSNEYTRAI